MVEIKILTQNTQLLPGWIIEKFTSQCKAKDERIPCIMDLINTYHIVGLQEVFDENCQNKIVRAWHTRHSLGTVRVNLDEVILAQKQKVASGGQAIINVHPNEIDAYIVYDKHFVMGPDSDLSVDIPVLKLFGVPRQDGGLLILTNEDYPIIAASGFVFSDTAEFRIDNWDAVSNKGVLYARVQVGTSRENYIHVFTTHMQAQEHKECPIIREKQLDELKNFIENATKKDGHPVVLLGDFNITAAEYNVLLQALPKDLVDALRENNPKTAGYTWIGEDPPKNPKSPWGTLGNVLAGQDGGPERFDFIFYSKGTSAWVLNPKSISLVPSEPPQTPYCFDDTVRVDLGFSVSKDADDDPFSLYSKVWCSAHEDCGSDGWGDSDTDILRKKLKKHNISLCEEASIKFMREAGGYEVGIIDYCKEGEKLILRCECPPWNPNVPCELHVYAETSTSCTCVRTSDRSCTLRSNTVSDHLGVEMTCDLVPDSRIKRIEVKIDKNEKITVKPNPVAISNGFYVEWHIEADTWGAKGFELKLPKHEKSPLGNVDEDILKWIEEPQPCKSVIRGPIEWPEGVKEYRYRIQFSKSPEQVSLTAILIDPKNINFLMKILGNDEYKEDAFKILQKITEGLKDKKGIEPPTGADMGDWQNWYEKNKTNLKWVEDKLQISTSTVIPEDTPSPQYCQGKTHIADTRRKYMNPNVKLEKLRDIAEEDVVRLLAHRAPGEEYKSIHPPLEEMEEPDCAVRQMVEPTEGAKAGDRIRYVQYTDSMFFSPITPYLRAQSAFNRYRGIDPGVLSGRTIIEARERDIEKIAKETLDSEIYDTARTGLRGRTVHGHAVRLDANGMMFDALRRWSVDERTKEVTYVKDMIGGAMDKEVVLGKPLPEADLLKRTCMYRNAQGGVWQEEDDPESMDVCAEIHWKRTVGGFQPWKKISEIKGGKKDVGVKNLKLFVPRGGVI